MSPSERVCTGLVVILAHWLLLNRLASTQEHREVDSMHDRQDSMEVTFITFPKTTSRALSSLASSTSAVSKSIEAQKSLSSPARSSGNTENLSMEKIEQLASDSEMGQVVQERRLNDSLRSQYEIGIRAAIERKWQQLGQSSVRERCTLRFTQSAGGVVTGAITEDCELPAEERSRLEAAVLMAQPLPYKGYESVFSTEIEVKF